MPRRVVPPTAPHTDPASTAATEAATNETLLLPALRQAGRVASEHGHWPGWNPHARFGEPFAVTGAPRSWPLFWPLALDDGGRWLDLLVFLHAGLALVLAFRFLRCLGLSRYAAFLGSGSYGLGWFAVVSADRLPEAAAAALLPGVLETTWRCVFARNRPLPAVWVGVLMTLSFATGGTATAWLGTLLATALLAAGLLVIDREDRLRAAGTWLLGVLIAALATAPLWLDALQNAPALRTPHEAATRSLQFEGLLGLFVPGLFGESGAAVPAAWESVNPRADGLELALYPGGIAWFLALLGLLRPKRSLMTLFWLFVAALGLLLTLDGPIADLAQSAFAFTEARPGASLVWLHLAVAVLVALGVEGFLDAPHQRAFALPVTGWFTITIFGLALVALAPPFASARESVARLLQVDAEAELTPAFEHLAAQAMFPGITITALAVAFLFWHRLGILRLKDLVAGIALSEFVLLALLGVPRGEPQLDDGGLAATLPAESRTVLLGRRGTPPGAFLAARDRKLLQTDSDAILDRTALWTERLDPVAVRVGARARIRPFRLGAIRLDDPDQTAMLRRAGIDSLVTANPITTERFGLAPPMPAGEVLLDAESGAASRLRRLGPAPPRARLAFRAERADDRHAAADLLVRSAHRGLDHVVLESATPLPTPALPERDAPLLVWERDDAEHQLLRVDMADGDGYLVVADAWAPGWEATVDGAPAEILPADVAFRALHLGPGRHEVRFDYRPWSRRFGLPLAIAGLILAAGLFGFMTAVSRRDRAARSRPKRRR